MGSCELIIASTEAQLRQRMNKAGTGKPWWVWVSLWAGTVLSVLAMLLYILIFDIDIPSIKPRPALENGVAALVYICHAINIIASALTGFAILQQEYVVVLCWVIWCAVHCVVLVVLVIMSSFTVLPSIPARIILHIIRLYSTRYKREEDMFNYDWRAEKRAPPPVADEVYNKDLSRESDVM